MRWIIIFLILKIQYECLSIYKILNVDIGIIYNVVLIFDIIHEYCFGLWWQYIDLGKQINIDKLSDKFLLIFLMSWIALLCFLFSNLI